MKKKYSKIFLPPPLLLMLVFMKVKMVKAQCDSNFGFCNPTGSENPNWSPISATGSLGEKILIYVGILFLLLVIYAGLKWMFSMGKAEEIKESQQTILWAVLGLILIFLSFSILDFVFGELLSFF
jgi:hypothetical protein